MKKVWIITYSHWRPRLPLGNVWVASDEQAARDICDLVNRLHPTVYEVTGFHLIHYAVDLIIDNGQEYHIGLPKAEAEFNTIPGDIRAMEEYRRLSEFAQKVRVALVPLDELPR